ncbi:MAG: CsiV family protein [Woeseiaceae bacterium]
MKSIFAKTMLFALAAGIPAALAAQDELLDEEKVPIKYYTVELIVFSYEENVGVGTEVFPPDRIAEPSDEIEEIVVEPFVRRHPDAVGLEPIFMTEEEFTMTDVAEHLERLDAYAPIMHVGWTQAGFPLQDTDPLELAVFGEPPVGLSGSFTLYLARYLHLVVDLSMDAPVEVVEIEFDDEPAYTFDDIGLPQGPVQYRILEDRIVKNGEVRYFDHPKFGVVAKVFRVEETEDGDESKTLLSRAVN